MYLFDNEDDHNSRAVTIGNNSRKAIESDFHWDGHGHINHREPKTAANPGVQQRLYIYGACVH